MDYRLRCFCGREWVIVAVNFTEHQDGGRDGNNQNPDAATVHARKLIPVVTEGALVHSSIREEFVRVCRDADETLDVYLDRAVEFIELGERLLQTVPNVSKREDVQRIFNEVTDSCKKAFPQVLAVAADTVVLVSGDITLAPANPDNLLEERRESFRADYDEAQGSGSARIVKLADNLISRGEKVEADLLKLQEQYREDLRLFHKALPSKDSCHNTDPSSPDWRVDPRYEWLHVIEDNSNARIDCVERLLLAVRNEVSPKLQELKALLKQTKSTETQLA